MERDHALEVLADDDSERAENLRVLYRMISRLDPLEKALITLWLDERDYKEIADITGLSRANVGTRLHRVKAKLQKQLQN